MNLLCFSHTISHGRRFFVLASTSANRYSIYQPFVGCSLIATHLFFATQLSDYLKLKFPWIEGLLTVRCFLYLKWETDIFDLFSFLNRTTETIARFIQPLLMPHEEVLDESPNWVATLTAKMARNFSRINRRVPIYLENVTLTANSGRIYFEQLHLHPVRLVLTFTQEWLDHLEASDTVLVFQFIRGMVRLSIELVSVT